MALRSRRGASREVLASLTPEDGVLAPQGRGHLWVWWGQSRCRLSSTQDPHRHSASRRIAVLRELSGGAPAQSHRALCGSCQLALGLMWQQLTFRLPLRGGRRWRSGCRSQVRAATVWPGPVGPGRRRPGPRSPSAGATAVSCAGRAAVSPPDVTWGVCTVDRHSVKVTVTVTARHLPALSHLHLPWTLARAQRLAPASHVLWGQRGPGSALPRSEPSLPFRDQKWRLDPQTPRAAQGPGRPVNRCFFRLHSPARGRGRLLCQLGRKSPSAPTSQSFLGPRFVLSLLPCSPRLASVLGIQVSLRWWLLIAS